MIRNTLGRLRIPSLVLATCALLSACEGSDLPLDTDATSAAAAPPAAVAQASGARVTASAPVATTAISTPVMFVTQVPTAGDIFAGRLAAFANHMTDMTSVPRGGDLMIRYPDGSLRNLTKEAGFGMEGRQGANAIAVREPTVHWDGKKAVFSMLVGAPTRQYEGINVRWQLYEVTNLAQGQVVGHLGHQARHVRGVLADRQKAARVDGAGIEGQEQAQVNIGTPGAFRRGQGPQVLDGHG